MRLSWLAIGIFACTLAGASAEAGSGHATIGQERPVSGVISGVDADERTIWLGPLRFYVPGSVFDLDELAEGDRAVVQYVQGADGLVATGLRLDTHPR